MAELAFIVGATGKVGKELISQIISKGDTDKSLHRNPTNIVGVASSSGFLYNMRGINESEVRGFSAKSIDGNPYAGTEELFNVLRGSSKPMTIVDVTASKDMLGFHTSIMRNTDHRIVTANKLPLTESSFETFEELVREPQRYGYRCSVMAGAEAVDKLRDMRDLGERPLSIEGSFSGTLGYITSEMENDKAFSDALRSAIKKGYTEPNPAIDLSGADVANKMLILVRTAGFNVSLADIKLEPFVDQKYLNYGMRLSDPKADFSELDRHMDGLMNMAKHGGCTLRYVAKFTIEENMPSISVGLKRVEKGSQLANLKGTSNKIIISANVYGESYYAVEAPGAGIGITAMNIRRDMLHQIKSRYMRG